MKHPWQVWLLFVVCVGAALSGMVWLTRQAQKADQMRRTAEAEAELEQRVNLALWRMDTELAPIIAEEIIRPTTAYRSTTTPAPLPPYVLLQFEVQPDGLWSSPQQAAAQARELPRLVELSKSVEWSRLIAELPSSPLPSAAELERTRIAANAAPASETSLQTEDPLQFFAGNSTNPLGDPTKSISPSIGQKMRKAADLEQRNLRYQSVAQQNLLNRDQSDAARQMQAPPADLPELIGVSRPLWIGDRLILARRIHRNGETLVQGAWLDWPRLKSRLLGEAVEALPQADLVPLNDETDPDPGRMLAGLPVRLVVNEPLTVATAGPTLRWALWIGWSAVLIAITAAAALLHGVIALSERRAAFVSSVTHELRSPLTTFRMYAEMLARDMVPDVNRQKQYFRTLQREAERLTLLVENVLAYARLERGRKPPSRDRTTLADLLARIGPRLADRAAQANMTCLITLNHQSLVQRESRHNVAMPDVTSPPQAAKAEARDQEFTTDTAVVEQILFNLVDNAAKYAQGATDRRIHVDASRNGSHVCLTVRDHGPGMSTRAGSDRSRPFGKSAQDSAESAPGVGLGLALCRRLARQLGGRLEVDATTGGGTTVRLVLPGKSSK